MSDEPTSVLRVLNGRLAGVEKALPASGSVTIGHQYWQDVVIRDPATKGIALELTLDGEGARVTVLSGEARLLGSAVQAGATALLPPYVPVAIGGIALAWGKPASARWGEASGLAVAVPAPPPPPPSGADYAKEALARAGDWLSGWRLPAIAAAGVMLIAATAAGPTMTALGFGTDRVARVELALDRAGFSELHATASAVSNVVTVSGVVANEADRAEADRALRDAAVPAQLAVQTSQDLAQASADVARLRGFKASARLIGRADVELHTSPLAPDARDQLVQAIRADVQEVRRVVLRDDLPAADEAPVKTVADATKKVSSVVAGDPAYIQTVDGARYFAGAMMPSGHKLVGIEGQTVLLEKDGRETRLNF